MTARARIQPTRFEAPGIVDVANQGCWGSTLRTTSVVELAAHARALSPDAFVARYGPVALLSKPSDEQLHRAALKMAHLVTVHRANKPQYLDDLLIMLYGFRTLSAYFVKPTHEGQVLTVGRDITCDVAINDPSVSKQHATMSWSRQTLQVRDERSTNGTFVNAAEISADGASLTNGDAVALGDFQLVFLHTPTLRSQLLLALPGQEVSL